RHVAAVLRVVDDAVDADLERPDRADRLGNRHVHLGARRRGRLRRRLRDELERRHRALGAAAAAGGDERERCEEGGGYDTHQYFLSSGCHLVTRTGSVVSSTSPSLQRVIVCTMKFSSSRFGESCGREWAPRLSLRQMPPSTMQSAVSSMFPSSIALVRSLLNTSPLSS